MTTNGPTWLPYDNNATTNSQTVIIIYESGTRYQYEISVDPSLEKLRRMLRSTREAVDRFSELVRRLPPLTVQRWASSVTQQPPAIQSLRRRKRRTCGEHNRYRVMV